MSSIIGMSEWAARELVVCAVDEAPHDRARADAQRYEISAIGREPDGLVVVIRHRIGKADITVS